MTRVVLLDTGPLGQVTHPKRDSKITNWLQSLRAESTELRVPEIADYELRRELLRAGKKHQSVKSIDPLYLDTNRLRDNKDGSRTLGKRKKRGATYS